VSERDADNLAAEQEPWLPGHDVEAGDDVERLAPRNNYWIPPRMASVTEVVELPEEEDAP
jgi:hypothetical protein